MYLKEYFLKEITPENCIENKAQRYFALNHGAMLLVKPTDNLDYCMELMSTKNQTFTSS
jgi:hypothetical protein